jgi:hypothetical protein
LLARVVLWCVVGALFALTQLFVALRQPHFTPTLSPAPGITRLAPPPPAVPTISPVATAAPSPTPDRFAGWTRGIATWFDAERRGQSTWYTRAGYDLYAAAGPALRELLGGYRHKQRFQIEIWSPKTGARFRIWVVDWCSCSKGKKRERLIDLAPVVFTKIGIPISRGIQTVYVRVVP